MKDIFSWDNLFHSLVAVAFVSILAYLIHLLFWWDWLGWLLGALAMIGLYLREASQVDWDFTLRFSFHKHMEWFVGSVCGFVASLIAVLVY